MAGAFQPDAFQPDAFQADAGGPPPVTGAATFAQAPATWDAVAIERFTSSATFAQVAATWDAAAIERYTAVAEWTQTGSWSALGTSAEDVIATATFTQETASWLAATAQLILGSGTWEQANSWDAGATEEFTGSATFEQSATWTAGGDVANPAVPVDLAGSWEQTASWGAIASTPEVQTGAGRRRTGRATPPYQDDLTTLAPDPIYATASFIQQPARWGAVIDVSHDAVELGLTEESVLALI